MEISSRAPEMESTRVSTVGRWFSASSAVACARSEILVGFPATKVDGTEEDTGAVAVVVVLLLPVPLLLKTRNTFVPRNLPRRSNLLKMYIIIVKGILCIMYYYVMGITNVYFFLSRFDAIQIENFFAVRGKSIAETWNFFLSLL